jgi:hypothetical protein
VKVVSIFPVEVEQVREFEFFERGERGRFTVNVFLQEEFMVAFDVNEWDIVEGVEDEFQKFATYFYFAVEVLSSVAPAVRRNGETIHNIAVQDNKVRLYQLADFDCQRDSGRVEERRVYVAEDKAPQGSAQYLNVRLRGSFNLEFPLTVLSLEVFFVLALTKQEKPARFH